MKIVIFVVICCFFSNLKIHAQTLCLGPASNNCFASDPGGSSRFLQTPEPNNLDFVFDNLSKNVNGITFSGSTVLKLKIDPKNVNCQWKLVMYVDNNGAPGDEWETIQTYGSTGSKPGVGLIQVRVYNACRTPQKNGIYQLFSHVATTLDIINPSSIKAAGPCNGTEVNSSGSYLTDYGEFSFIIDYRIIPDFSLKLTPGSYQINIKFCLVEE